MMSDFGAMISATFSLFQTPFTMYGFTFTWFEVFAFSIVVGIVGWILYELFR